MKIIHATLALVAACSGPTEPTAVAREEVPPTAAARSASPEPEASPPQAPGVPTVRVLRLSADARPDLDGLASSSVEIEGSAEEGWDQEGADEYSAMLAGPSTYPRVEFPEHADALNAALRDESIAIMTDMGAPPLGSGSMACRTAIARTDFVALTCSGTVVPDRGYPDTVVRSRHYRVEGARLIAFELREVLLSGTDLDAMVRQRCRQRARGVEDAEERCRGMPSRAELTLAPLGIRVEMPSVRSETGLERAEIRYAELDGKILADGALGRALAEHGRIEEVPRPAIDSDLARGRAVSSAGPLGELLHRWLRLSAADRAVVRVAAERADESRLVVGDEVSEEDATRIAVALGGEAAEAWEWSGGAAEPVLAITRTELNLRNTVASWSSIELAIPEGTLVIAVRGRALGRSSSFGREGTWARVSVSRTLDGWVAGNLLREHEGCRPEAAPFLTSLPASARERAERSLVTSVVDLQRRGATARAAAFVGALRPLRSRRGDRAASPGRFRVTVYALDEQRCALGERLASHDVDGVLWALHMIGTRARGGDPLLVIGARHGPAFSHPIPLRYSIFELGASAPAWTGETHDFAEVHVGRERDGRYEIFRAAGGRRETVVVRENGRLVEHGDDVPAAP